MKRLLFVFPYLLVGLACGSETASSPPADRAHATPSASSPVQAPVVKTEPVPPVAAKIKHTETLHGQERSDDYFWLRKKDSPEVLGYLAAENAYTRAMMGSTEGLQEQLYKEMLARVKETDLSVPVKRGDYLYYSRTEAGKQYAIYCRKKATGDAAETVLLDLNEIGKTEKYVGVGFFEVSDDGNQIAYGLDTTGFRQFVLHVKDLKTGKEWSEHMPRVDSVAWAKDNKTILYVTEDATTKRGNQLHRHVLGQDAAKDDLVFEEKDERFALEVRRSRSKEWIFISSESKTTTEARIVPAAKPKSAPVVLAPREQGHEYYVDHGGGLFYIRTNSGGRNFRLVTAKVNDPARAKWKEVIPHREDVMLEDVHVFADHYVLHERQDASPVIRIVHTDAAHAGQAERVDMPERVYSIREEPNPEFASKLYRYGYESFTTPQSVFDYDVATREKKLLKRTEVLGGYDASQYESERLYATARDGTKVPISLLHKKEWKPDGTHPMLLDAYGSYGYPYPLRFNSNRFSLVDRGVVMAVAHIRGGGDLGKKWHDQGRMMAKMNTFTDFIDSAEFLMKEGWVNKSRLAIQGGSAGGLLMGAVTNMRPDLFKAVIAHVPFVDVINTMLDESLPLTVGEFEEWGNPKIKEQYDYMMTYSPYDNVAPKDYPTILVRTSYNDSQVMYWEPAKYVAKLRATSTGKNPLLFKINMDPAGHGGQSGRYDKLRDAAFDYAFLLGQLR
ncbi:S9 family peptidase [Pendulispora brunnea]|uniref:S9 family peptidase n=1 Tax=Pendulispora brunnea TaxID=2905690 RepID=A0ABZ2KJQ2_9BACT